MDVFQKAIKNNYLFPCEKGAINIIDLYAAQQDVLEKIGKKLTTEIADLQQEGVFKKTTNSIKKELIEEKLSIVRTIYFDKEDDKEKKELDKKNRYQKEFQIGLLDVADLEERKKEIREMTTAQRKILREELASK